MKFKGFSRSSGEPWLVESYFSRGVFPGCDHILSCSVRMRDSHLTKLCNVIYVANFY